MSSYSCRVSKIFSNTFLSYFMFLLYIAIPEIKINLAETEDLSGQETGEEKCDMKCDKEDISEPEMRKAIKHFCNLLLII